MGELIYTFASIASRFKNGTTALTGMRRLADTLHPLGVPVTWLVSPDSARAAAAQITEWHDAFGDEVAVAPPELSISHLVADAPYGARRDRYAAARDAIQKVMPWAECAVAAGHTDPDIVRICAELGFEGLWGFCWEQIEVDDITDRGCPWGFYYMDRDDRLRPARGRGPVAMEWTAHDLLKTFHSGSPWLYSTDPNDVGRGGLCAWEDTGYWKAVADQYLRNTRHNGQVILLQHQESHEMEIADGWRCYTEEDIREALVFLDAFVRHLKPKARIMTLAQAARAYRERNEHTASSYMLWDDVPAPRHNPDYAWNNCPGPWPRTFLFYDRDAQMVFVDGQVHPACLRNYGKAWDRLDYYAEHRIPRPKLIRNTQFTWSREIEIVVESDRALPYGLTLWGDYSLYQLGDCPGLIEGKILPHELLFLRYDLQPGENRLLIRLQGK